MEATNRITGNKFEEYKCCANDVVHFKLIRKESEVLQDDGIFKPEMSHQIFGESENIFGYRDLRVNVYFTAARMETYINYTYTDKLSPQDAEGVNPDDVLKLLSAHLAPGSLTNTDTFISYMKKDETFRPFGELIHSYHVNKAGQGRTFEIYKTNIEAAGFRDYHERLQPLLLFYVDAASYIDVDDGRWDFYLLYEKYMSEETGAVMHAFAGYMTAYNYYSYPEMTRPRISQVLVLPPFQRQGHGANLLKTFYNDCLTRDDVRDITVEDPSEDFQRVRDFVDAQNCSRLKVFQPLKLLFGFSEDHVRMARQHFKINRKQARRVYEILRLKNTDRGDAQLYKAYRLDIKKRLNVPFQKRGRDFEKLNRVLDRTELAAAMNNMSKDQRWEYLQTTFEETIEEYGRVVERLNLGE